MKKSEMSKLVVPLLLIACASSANAASVTHTGIIENIYFNDSARFAVKFFTNFESAAVDECPSFNGFAGGRTSYIQGTSFDRASHMQDLLFDAYKNQLPVTIVTSGCFGNWIHIRSVIGAASPPS